VLLAITDEDIETQGQWPFPDQILAQALEILTQYQPRAIGLDLYRDLPILPGSDALQAALVANPRIIAITKFGMGEEKPIPPPAALRGTERVGFNDFILDPGGVVRRGLLFLDDGTQVFYAFALRLALRYLQDEGITPRPDDTNPTYLRLGPRTIRPFNANDGGYVGADARGYQFLLDFHGGAHPFPTFTLTALLAGNVPATAIRNKIVLFGVAVSEGVKDFFFTPYSHGHGIDQRMAGITLHAHSTSQLLRAAKAERAMIGTLSESWEAWWCLLWSVFGGLIGLWTRFLWRFVLAVLGSLVLLGAVVYGAICYDWWLPIVPPTLAWLSTAALVAVYLVNQEKEQRAFLMQLFSRHVSREVAEVIWQRREQFLEGGRPRPQRVIASVLFSDLAGFTSVSEKLSPQELMVWLNEYMDAMAQQIEAHDGVISKYMGDAIMALFGVPLVRVTETEIGQDAINAVRCALAMEEKLKQLNEDWHRRGMAVIGMRIGIFTGPLVAGSLGSSERLEYTVIGDTVNTASRLESFDKHILTPEPLTKPCRILVGETTAKYLGQHFQLEHVDEVTLKGKEEKVTVYQVVRPTVHETSERRQEDRG
jgi:adenylate cyclase